MSAPKDWRTVCIQCGAVAHHAERPRMPILCRACNAPEFLIRPGQRYTWKPGSIVTYRG